ncbi:NADH dehydrogenase (ubiquinone) complex I, assembly factor 6-like [Littorina saxatilis]|uniref:NADH dehydrogenase (ubiquinone) complex I, assembly factor 6 n=1 Tax=Littorina saxatilis TaxID=31220 RepID=A0AAN9BYG1_9CAEN
MGQAARSAHRACQRRLWADLFSQHVCCLTLCNADTCSYRALSSQKVTKVSNPAEYCVNLVRTYDYENYLCCLLLPKHVQRAVFAVRAFNVEIAQVRDVVSEKAIGAMRMQFWKDFLGSLGKGVPPQTPVAVELSGATEYFKLPKRHFNNIIDARDQQLNKDGFSTVQELEKYAEVTASSLHYLTLACLGIQNVHADHAASHIGKAQGLTTVLRAIPHHAQRRRVYLPLDLILKHKLSQEDVMRGRSDQSVLDAVFDLASTANTHLNTARSFTGDVPREAHVAFLNALPCDLYLQRLQAANFNVFDPKLQVRVPSLPLRLWLQKIKKKY